MGIVRAGAGFRVILQAEERLGLVALAFVGVIVQVDVGDFHFAGGQRIGVHAEAVILRGDFHLLGQQILYGMLRAVVAEFEFEGFSAERQAAQVVAEASSEYRDASDELANICDGVMDRLGVAGAIGEKHAIGAHFQNFFSGSLRGHYGNFAMMVDQQAQNILLDAKVVRDDAKAARFAASARFAHMLRPGRSRQLNGARVPHVGFRAADAAGQPLPGHARQLLGFVNQLIRRRAIGRDDTAKRAEFANVANQRARLDVPDGGNLVALQIKLRRFRGTPVGTDLRKLAHNQRFDVGLFRLFIIEVGAHISYVRIREADNLPGVTGAGEYFLISGETSVKNYFCAAARDCAGRAAVKYAPVFQRENRRSVRNFRQCILPNSLADILPSLRLRFRSRSTSKPSKT